ncbi:MAG TPA: hypothetical protein VK186_09385, partial [Candidatus Deferrimicrobium sp.]|nr:hypothetical protein [Candidatus Deferrimicrobium sp.]
SKGSFYIGPDSAGKNPLMRVMGFFNSKEPGKSLPRAGVRALKKIQAENGCYVFSFDFYVRTGNEKPSFWLAKGLIEERPRFMPNEWVNVIFIVNNLSNQYDSFQPLVRMWGTGTMLVDNVFFAKITSANFSINSPYESYVYLLKRD